MAEEQGGRNFFPEEAVFEKDEDTGRNFFPEAEKKLGFFGSMLDAVTGTSRMTPEIEGRPDVVFAEEFTGFSNPLPILGLMASDTPEKMVEILRDQFGDKVAFSKDDKENIVAHLESGDYPLNAPGMSSQDIAKFMLEVAAFMKGGKAKTIAGAVTGAAGGEAGLELLEQAGTGEGFGKKEAFESVRDVGEASAWGLGGKVLENLFGSAARYFKGSDEVDDVVKAGEEIDVPVATSDVVESDTYAKKFAVSTGEKAPFMGTGPMRAAQQQKRGEAVDRFIGKHEEWSYESVVKSLLKKRDKIKNKAGDVLNQTGETLDNVGEIPTNSTNSAIASSSGALSRPGVIQSGSPLDKIQTLIDAMDEAPQTFTSLKENRTEFREIVETLDPTSRSQLSSRQKALLKEIEAGMTKDLTKFAQQNLPPDDFKKWQKANKIYAQHVVDMKKTKIKNLLDKGDVTPEIVDQMLLSKKKSEVKKLYDSLTPKGRQNAKAAIINKVVDKLSTRVGGLTPNSFATEMAKLKIPTDVFFKGQDRAELEGLLKVLNATRKAQDASAMLQTGQQNSMLATLAGVATMPLTTIAGIVGGGGLARLYESKQVRDLLLKASTVPAGSTEFEKIMRQFMEVATPIVQTSKDKREEK